MNQFSINQQVVTTPDLTAMKDHTYTVVGIDLKGSVIVYKLRSNQGGTISLPESKLTLKV